MYTDAVVYTRVMPIPDRKEGRESETAQVRGARLS